MEAKAKCRNCTAGSQTKPISDPITPGPLLKESSTLKIARSLRSSTYVALNEVSYNKIMQNKAIGKISPGLRRTVARLSMLFIIISTIVVGGFLYLFGQEMARNDGYHAPASELQNSSGIRRDLNFRPKHHLSR